MHRLFYILVLLPLSLAAQEPDPAVIELRETISKIIDIQTLESEERLDWEAKKAEMEKLLEVHRRELELLNEELEKAGQSAPGHLEKTEEMQAEIESLKAARRITSEAVARTAPRILELLKRFPTPLLKDCETEQITLQEWKTGTDPREALQAELSILAKADQFNRRLTRTADVQGNREVEVIYLGLAAAYYSGNSKSSGIGRPGPDGWVWTEQADLRSEINKLFEMLDKKRPPSMITLPLQIQ